MVLALASSVVVVSLAVVGLNPAALTARTVGCYELPANIHTAVELRLPITRLLVQSRTLRAQCARIAAARTTQVTVTITTAPLDSQTRARSRARRYDSGLLIVDIEIPAASQDFLELLAHEFEHATEIIEGLDFKALAGSRGAPQIQRRSDGSFESDRATQAGRAAAAELP
jgi:hypothetical protein